MHSENDTLIILTPGWAGSETDTNCLPMQQGLVRTLKENYPGLNIIILAFQYPYFKKTYHWFGTTVISFNGKNKGGLTRLLRMRELNTALKNISSRNKVKGLLSFWYGECAAVGKKFADKNKLQHFCWILGQDARKENKFPGRVHANAGELIALSDFLQDEFEKNHSLRPRHIVPPGIDARQFSTPAKEKDIDIIGAGSLIPLKQYDIFISVIAEIKKQMPGIKAMLIGNGPERNRLQTLIASYGLELNIILTGELSHPEVLKCMQRAKVLLHPSSYEGFGVVAIEALYAGCHVASFCKPMKRDVEQWHIVGSKEEMIRKATDLLQKENLYKSITPFTVDDTAKKIRDLFYN